MHKYKKEHEYHEQTTTASVLDAVLEIICHNDYKLHRKNPIFDLGYGKGTCGSIGCGSEKRAETGCCREKCRCQDASVS